MFPMRDVLGDRPRQKRDGAAVEAGLDPLLQITRQFLLVLRDLVLVTGLVRARLGVLLFGHRGPLPLTVPWWVPEDPREPEPTNTARRAQNTPRDSRPAARASSA
jgi:hypothetical protein